MLIATAGLSHRGPKEEDAKDAPHEIHTTPGLNDRVLVGFHVLGSIHVERVPMNEYSTAVSSYLILSYKSTPTGETDTHAETNRPKAGPYNSTAVSVSVSVLTPQPGETDVHAETRPTQTRPYTE